MKTQQFNNVQLTQTKVKNNILRVWNKTSQSDRHDWYLEANQFCLELSERYHISNSIVIGILSALSPLKTWEQNKLLTEQLIETKDAGQIRMFVNKAIDILESTGTDQEILKILNGKKIKAFYQNIKYPFTSDTLTIDRHGLSIALGYKIKDEEYSMTAKQYKFFVDCYKLASDKVNVSPLLVQSSTWIYFRKQIVN